MNYFIDYLGSNYVLIIMLIGMFMLTMRDVFLDKDMLIKLRCTIVIILAVSIFSYAEEYCGNLEYLTIWRFILSAICYSLRPIVIMMIIFIVYKKVSMLIVIPAIVNIIFSFSCFFTDIVFTFDPDNTFKRGVLGYEPYIVSGIYLLLLLFLSIRYATNHSVKESMMMISIAVASMGSAYFTLRGYESNTIVDHTAGAMILIYYLFIYAQHTKRDSLTGLYNRQSYYSDINRYGDEISGVISIDMNELKRLNDTMGHQAGDDGIVAVSACFSKNASSGDRVYRVGGDEFFVLCRRKDRDEVAQIVADMRRSVDESGYSCAFGYSTGKSIEDMIKEADAFMYEDKERIKADCKAKGINLHMKD